MKKYRVLISAFVFFFCLADSTAQDLILKKDGTKIFCSIVQIDSSSIFYLRPTQKNISVISKTEVQTYYTAKKANGKNSSTTDSTSGKQELFIIKLAGGFANPIGDFGSKDFESETSGLANAGLLLNASLILKFSKYFGFVFDYRYQKNAVDNDAIHQAYSSQYSSGISFSTQATNWTSHGFFSGLYFEAPLVDIKNLSFDFSLLGGLPKFESPELNITATKNGTTINIVQNVGKTSALAFETKMGLKYKFETVALNFGVSYFTAKPNFSGVLIQGSNGVVDYAKFQQRISSLNVEAGISFLLYHK